jgi:aspartate/glutamate racemase
MNEYDRDNLKFLLTIDEATFKDWYNQMDEDDHEYAQELLNRYAQELKEQSAELLIEAELVLDPNYSLARAVINSVK